MPSHGFCKIEGETQGVITEGALGEESLGSAWMEGHEGDCTFHAFEQEAGTGRDMGVDGGRRIYHAVRITKVIDKSSPRIQEALKSNESLPQVVFTFIRADATGQQEEYYKITLEQARISNIRNYMPDSLDPANATLVPMQDVSFAYEKITWQHVIGRTECQDSWSETG